MALAARALSRNPKEERDSRPDGGGVAARTNTVHRVDPRGRQTRRFWKRILERLRLSSQKGSREMNSAASMTELEGACYPEQLERMARRGEA